MSGERKDALLPCPWCGHAPTVRFVGDEDGGYHEVACYTPRVLDGDLFCGVHADTEELAISAWNRRLALDEARQTIESALALIRLHVQPGSDDEYTATAVALHTLLATLPAKTAESSPTREEMRKVLAAVANAHRLIRGDCPGAAGDVLRTITQSTSAYQVPATERVDD